MAGIENNIVFGGGFKLQTSSARDISDMQRVSSDVSNINYIGNPETNISANPSSLCHNPTTGDLYKKDSGTGNTGWSLLGSGSGFTSINIQTFTASGTYTPTANMKYCIVEGVGGGAGGGATNVSVATSVTASGGGGSGGYVKVSLTAAEVGASAAIVIGAGGAGGTGSSNGSNGGDTTFTNAATTLVFNAGGGVGGSVGVSGQSTFSLGGLGGSNTLGAFNGYEINGSPGGNGFGLINGFNGHDFANAGNGGNSFFGGGGLAGGFAIPYNTPTSLQGTNAIANTGSGGGGSANSTTSSIDGADGADGIVIITEYI